MEELLININSGHPGMEGVPGGTYHLRKSGAIPHWLNVGFCVFLYFRFFYAFEVTHVNCVLATAHTIPNVSFFGNWVEILKVTIHQLHRSRWISACNEAAGYDRTFSSGCKSVRTILYFML